MFRRIALTTLVAAATFGTVSMATASFAPASAQINITFGAPPPPVRYEAVPAPRSGQVWAPGQWQLVNDQYVWQPGQWQQARAGYRYMPDSWNRETVNGRDQWRYQPSRWDRDGDGIPNRNDQYDNRNDRAYGDKDRDGIPNRYDRNDNRSNNNATNPFGDRDRDGIPNILDNQNNNRR
jgi:hypothetical protein